jgi:hypothetical protein
MVESFALYPPPPYLPTLPYPPPSYASATNQASSPTGPSPPYEGDSIQIGYLRDGANNLDGPDSILDGQVQEASKRDPRIHINAEIETFMDGHGLHTYSWKVDHGVVAHVKMEDFCDLAGRSELASFVASTLDEAYLHGRKHVWLFLVDHGAGDAGCNFTQEPDGSIQHASLDTLRGAINDGIALHKKRYPADTDAHIEGVIMHQCYMATLVAAQTLSAAKVQYLAATSESSMAPGPSGYILLDIAEHPNDPLAQGRALDDRVMNTVYEVYEHGHLIRYHPVANFMMLDLDPAKMQPLEREERKLNRELVKDLSISPLFREDLLEDINSVQGMDRDRSPGAGSQRLSPWSSDRPSVAVYMTIAADPRLPPAIRSDAEFLAHLIMNIVIHHVESKNYLDAGSPTLHFPTSIPNINPCAPSIRETDAAESDLNGQNAVISELNAPVYPAQVMVA